MTRFPWPLAAAIDVVLVVAFAALGMLQHHGGFTTAGLVQTAWPFVAALAVGWLVSLAWRAPASPLRTGVAVWAVTVVGGMILRGLSGGGTAVSFVVVGAVTLLLFLVGWRAAAALVIRLRRRSAPSV